MDNGRLAVVQVLHACAKSGTCRDKLTMVHDSSCYTSRGFKVWFVGLKFGPPLFSKFSVDFVRGEFSRFWITLEVPNVAANRLDRLVSSCGAWATINGSNFENGF